MYADTNGNEKYNIGDGVVGIINLERGVIIQTVSPFILLSINFRPPDPRTKISGAGIGEAANIATITLAIENDPARIKRVKVNTAGLIYVK